MCMRLGSCVRGHVFGGLGVLALQCYKPCDYLGLAQPTLTMAFVCRACDKSYSNNSSLRRHQKNSYHQVSSMDSSQSEDSSRDSGGSSLESEGSSREGYQESEVQAEEGLINDTALECLLKALDKSLTNNEVLHILDQFREDKYEEFEDDNELNGHQIELLQNIVGAAVLKVYNLTYEGMDYILGNMIDQEEMEGVNPRAPTRDGGNGWTSLDSNCFPQFARTLPLRQHLDTYCLHRRAPETPRQHCGDYPYGWR
jgi:hypothetical protein